MARLTTTALAILAAAILAPSALAQTSVTMFSQSGDYILNGGSRYYDNSNGSVVVGGDAAYVTVGVSGGDFGDYYSMDFAAPPGKKLHPGLYVNAQRAPFRTAGRPGIDIYGDGRGCNVTGGRFDVKEIAVGPTGSIRRLWLTYEQHCENDVQALFGEVRFGVPEETGLSVSPRSVWWPDTYVGTNGKTLPVTVRNTGSESVLVDHVAVVGSNPSNFPVLLDECTGSTLGPGDTCAAFIRFSPSKAGPRFAKLNVVPAEGSVARAVLDGHGEGGLTRLVMDSEPGDYIGQGLAWSYTPADTTFGVQGTRDWIGTRFYTDDGWWDVNFYAPPGEVFVPGTTYPVSPLVSGDARLDISGYGRGCSSISGSFTVNQLAFLGGSLRSESIDFVQHCGPPALTGTLDFKAPSGDTTPPGSVTGLRIKRRGSCGTLSWTNPTDADYRLTVVRYLQGTTAPGSPSGSFRAASGSFASTTICGLATWAPLQAAAWAVDEAGNVSGRTAASAPRL